MSKNPDSKSNSLDTTAISENSLKSRYNKLLDWDKRWLFKIYKPDGSNHEKFIARFVSIFGSLIFWLPIWFIIWFISAHTYNYILFSQFSGLFDQNFVFFMIIKYIFKRKRPFEKFTYIISADRSGRGYSFPSGHTTFFTLFSFLFIFHYNLLFLIFVSLSFAVIIGYTRILLGVHYPVDIIAGIIFGICFFLIFWFFTQTFWVTFYGDIASYFEKIL